MPAKEVQSTLDFVGEHQGITVAFVGLLILLIIYLWKEVNIARANARKAAETTAINVVADLRAALELQRETIDNTLNKLDATIGKLEKTITDLAAELFRDMHSLDRRLSKLEGEHEAHHRGKKDE